MPPYALKPIHISCTKSHAALSLPARLAGMSRRGLLEEQGRERAAPTSHGSAAHTLTLLHTTAISVTSGAGGGAAGTRALAR